MLHGWRDRLRRCYFITRKDAELWKVAALRLCQKRRRIRSNSAGMLERAALHRASRPRRQLAT